MIALSRKKRIFTDSTFQEKEDVYGSLKEGAEIRENPLKIRENPLKIRENPIKSGRVGNSAPLAILRIL